MSPCLYWNFGLGINHLITYVVYATLERSVVMCLLGFCQAIRIHVVRRTKCSLDLMIRNRQNFFKDHIQLLHAALMQNRVLYRGEVDQLQEVVSTNVAHLGNSYSFSQIFLGHPSLHLQTHYFVAMRSTGLHQGKRLEEAKEMYQNNFQRSGRSYIQMLFLQKP